MRAIGICLGASSISIVEISKDNDIKVVKHIVKGHEGNPKKVLKEELAKFEDVDSIAVTGRKFRKFVNLSSITEPEAVENAFEFVNKQNKRYDALVSVGGETFMVYVLDEYGKISSVHTGNKCASGTGEFFLQQIRRMDLSVDDAIKLARDAVPHKVAGRCSVFCKSDCTHALNKGEPKGNVAAGLCEMMAKKVSELLARVEKKRVMLIGGSSQNSVMLWFLQKDIPNVEIPDEATYFEALGAALWALSNKTKKVSGKLFVEGGSSFEFLPALKQYEEMVEFKEVHKSYAKEGDECVVGLDVGSTTTKAVLMRKSDDAILGSIYLRTMGDPVNASRKCYQSLFEQLNGVKVKIVGLGVTGSGRQIAGLHSLSKGIVNEIIAHAKAAVYFDEEVDTIFEIGGQDAKYTFITNGVASDYAMNEACSAGTGSFLEESAKESLGIDVEKIADIALKGDKPPNFNDQCAAFISSDIKNASQEGISKENIVAGLIYSIGMNYVNRVKGARPVGKKVFMQGGVCYNKAVPIAMAGLIGKSIVVPPEPGLMGASGGALVIQDEIKPGLLGEEEFDLKELAEREVEFGKSFICMGGEEKCDRKCEINMIKVKGRFHPFGGACNKYYNIRLDIKVDSNKLDLVDLRQRLVFEKYCKSSGEGRTIGINKSFVMNSLYPLFYNFFTGLGLKVVLSEKVLQTGIDRKGAAFCYPAEISHGLFEDLLNKNPDSIFLPLIIELDVGNVNNYKKTCPFVQGEPYYLRTAFKDRLKDKKIISPVLNFSTGYASQEKVFAEIGKELGFGSKESLQAYRNAVNVQGQFSKECKEIGARAIAELEKDPDRFAMVLFGRPYNAFAFEGNMGIPHKFASRGIMVMPYDFLPFDEEKCDDGMYWAMGQMILKAASFVKRHNQLFGTYITNFSCGPDSFVVGYFRDLMGVKPSLTLELDSHTADAGVNTRIEAVIDIINSYRELSKRGKIVDSDNDFQISKVVISKGRAYVLDENGVMLPMTHSKVKMYLPSMDNLAAPAIAAVFKSLGVDAEALPSSDMDILKLGRGNTTCKECLPMQLTVGGLLKKIEKRQDGQVIVYFMPSSSGPCRFGQYKVFIESLLKKNKIKNVALLSLADQDSYGGFGTKFSLNAWKGVIVADVMNDVLNAIKALAVDREYGEKVFFQEWENILRALEKNELYRQLEKTVQVLKKIELKKSIDDAKFVALIGEIYVRRDELSRQGLIEVLAERGFVVKVAHISEWIYYTNYIAKKSLGSAQSDLKKKAGILLREFFQDKTEVKIKNIIAKGGLYKFEKEDIEKTIEHGSKFVNPHFTGEALLTVGLALREILHTVHGVISIGPFGCMPSRVAEAILAEEMNVDGKQKASGKSESYGLKDLPFLAIETDGNVFPQLIEARLETFCLQAERVWEKMRGE
ncbi:activase [Candidatus Woesearchaeota archaeon]|nr:activase [Candidatus Woesearchaeota archaeon]